MERVASRPAPAAEATAAFLLSLRARGMRDLNVLRALETVPRESFVPHRYADLAIKDVALPIPCGQAMSEPFVIAKMMDALVLTPDCRVLEIGGGSGYATAVLARLAGSVLSIERYRTLAAQARARLDTLALGNAVVVWGDGLAGPAGTGLFDRLLVHAAVDGLPAVWFDRLSPGAIAVFARSSGTGAKARQRLIRAARSAKGDWLETAICPCRLRPLQPGPSLVL